MAKNIVILCDGTGNDRTHDDRKTNVARLADRAVHDEHAPIRQKVHYDAGVGTEWGDLVGKATGTGISRNIQDAYDFIVANYDPGDRIFVFGFSRGAYTVRSLAGLIGLCGVARASVTWKGRQVDLRAGRDEAARKEIVAEAYRIYKITDDTRKGKGAEFQRTYGYPEHADEKNRAVHFIGVWDTVRSLGVPIGITDIELTLWPHRFHDHELGEHVGYAFHALSIDDDRMSFHPTLWNEPTIAQRKAAETGQPPRQVFEQVWFPGVHSDVGGGYKEHGLADRTLIWMIERAIKADPPLLLKQPYDQEPLKDLKADPKDTLHDPRDKLWKRVFYRVAVRNVCRGEQAPGSTTIKKTDEAAIDISWLHRFNGLYNAYDPPNTGTHPDCGLARRQRSAGDDPPPGPWTLFKP